MKLVSGTFTLPAFGGERDPKGGTQAKEVHFKILDSYIKHYPVEYHAQTAVEATVVIREQLLRSEGEPALTGITEIEIGSYDVAIEIIGRDPEKWHPQSRETADHSFPYCVAVALLDGTVSLRSFDPKRLADPLVLALMQKVRVVELPDFQGWYPNAMPTRIRVRTAAGKEYVKQVDFPLGHPRNPMSDREVEEKFRLLAAGTLDHVRAGKLIEQLWRFETLADIGKMMPLLKVTGHGTRE